VRQAHEVRDRERLGLWVMAAPFLIGVAVLVVLPAFLTFGMSLFGWDLIRCRGSWGSTTSASWSVIRPSARPCATPCPNVAIAVPLRLVLAVALALLLQPRVRGVGTARGAVFLPAVIPDVAYGLLWLWILNLIYGPLVTEGGPPPKGTLYLPLFIYRNAFVYFRYGYAAATGLGVPPHRLDRVASVPDRAPLARRLDLSVSAAHVGR
jgi:ABC-type sugar transport system permease subunit